jgi:hypothetical protein
MEEVYSQQFSVDSNARLRDMEEKQRLLKDRVLLIGKSFVEDKEQMLEVIRDMKKTVTILQKENERLKELIGNITEQLSHSARKEEIEILRRQLDLMRK